MKGSGTGWSSSRPPSADSRSGGAARVAHVDMGDVAREKIFGRVERQHLLERTHRLGLGQHDRRAVVEHQVPAPFADPHEAAQSAAARAGGVEQRQRLADRVRWRASRRSAADPAGRRARAGWRPGGRWRRSVRAPRSRRQTSTGSRSVTFTSMTPPGRITMSTVSTTSRRGDPVLHRLEVEIEGRDREIDRQQLADRIGQHRRGALDRHQLDHELRPGLDRAAGLDHLGRRSRRGCRGWTGTSRRDERRNAGTPTCISERKTGVSHSRWIL